MANRTAKKHRKQLDGVKLRAELRRREPAVVTLQRVAKQQRRLSAQLLALQVEDVARRALAEGAKQSEVAAALGISQASVSNRFGRGRISDG